MTDKDKDNKLKVGTKLYYSDSKKYFGEVILVLKRDVKVWLANGGMENRTKTIALKMLKRD